ncbi:hypothetical protein SB775_34100, partial [Peribacillus sp. SIMBA_075]|uniref:hypothetical protein n=1 Tax=Peribacillus sp. SIMBA_075 TaxID=3085813 RepID=UPI00397B9080
FVTLAVGPGTEPFSNRMCDGLLGSDSSITRRTGGAHKSGKRFMLVILAELEGKVLYCFNNSITPKPRYWDTWDTHP